MNEAQAEIAARANDGMAAIMAHAHNAPKPRLAHLPNELLHLIFSYFDASPDEVTLATMALRATCVHFYHLFASPLESVHPITKSVLQQKYSLILRKQRLHALCLLDPPDPAIAVDEMLVCSLCLTLHPQHMFFPNSLRDAPEDRLCKGHQGVLDVCGLGFLTWEALHTGGMHFWYPFLDAQQRAQRLKGYWSNWWLPSKKSRIGPQSRGERGAFIGTRSAHEEIFGSRDGVWKWKEEGAWTRTKEEYLLRREWFIMECRSREPVPVANVILGLGIALKDRYQTSDRLCEHLDLRAVKKLMYEEKRDQPGSKHECPAEHCQTVFYFERQIVPSAETIERGVMGATEELALVVVRNLGTMEDVTDAAWVGQAKEPERVPGLGTRIVHLCG